MTKAAFDQIAEGRRETRDVVKARDVVTRLREWISLFDDNSMPAAIWAMEDAADEVTRLRAALAGAVEMTERSAKEIDRLEVALATARRRDELKDRRIHRQRENLRRLEQLYAERIAFEKSNRVPRGARSRWLDLAKRYENRARVAEAALATARNDAFEEAAQAAVGPVFEINTQTNEPRYHGTEDGNWSVPQPIAGFRGDDYGTGRYDAAKAVRALKSQPECETCRGDPETCASVPGLRHCEKAMRGRL